MPRVFSKVLISSGPVSVSHLQLALQWQYELLRSSQLNHSSADSSTSRTLGDVEDLTTCESGKKAAHLLEGSPSTEVSGMVSAEGKPPSLSSFDSGFDGAGSSRLEAGGGREGVDGPCRSAGTKDSVRPAMSHPQIIPSVCDPEDLREEFDLGSVGNSSRASIQITPKVTVDSLNLEIKVKRSAALPNNPWLSLPVDAIENSYTVTITQNAPQKEDLQLQDPFEPFEPCTTGNHSNRSRDQPTQTELLSSTQPRGPQNKDWIHLQSSLDDPELSPIRNILSSTITDGRDKSLCTTEGIPTLLWDSYDLHDQNHDATDSVIDISLNDWDVKEQEHLREVEEILDRADEILEKEENVLAQEAVLNALLSSENQWPLWDSEMTPSELTEAGVLGLEDYLDPAESENLSETRYANASEDDGHCAAVPTEAETVAFHSRPDLLTELNKVHVLDELIMEENLKIHELRRCKESPKEELSVIKPLDTNGPSSMSKEREAFRLQLEKEKMEVEKLEKSLNKERKVKLHKDRARKVVKCSIMGKARSESKEDRALCDELLSGSLKRSQTRHSTSLVQNDSQAQDTNKTENIQAVLGPDDAKKAAPLDFAYLSDFQNQDHLSGAEPSVFNGATSDAKETPEEVGIQPQRCIDMKKIDDENASLTSNMRPDDGVFDPGGKCHLPPVPKPRKASLPLIDNLTEHEPPYSTEPQKPAPSSVAQDPNFVQLDLQDNPLDALPENETPATSHNLFLNPDVKEHSSNNNNNNHALVEECTVPLEHLCEMSTKDEEDTTEDPACSLQRDSLPAEEVWTSPPDDERPHQQSAPQLPPDQPLEFDPGGRDEHRDSPDGVQSSEAMRISGSGAAGIQAQININTTKVTDFKTPIVLDTGSGLMKAGFADQDLPNITFPTIIGMPKYEEIMNGQLERETFIGFDAQHMRGVLALKHPIKNGIIRNWDDMEKIWHYTFQQLCVDPDDHPVLLTEAAMNPLENRQRMVEIMFECFNVPFTYVAMQAVLALYAAGRSTGVVFDSGDGVSHSVPVFEGYSLPYAVQRFPLAGVDVTMHLKKLLQEQGVCMRTTAEMEIVREMKEKCCCVALNYEAELSQGGASSREMHYTMPDGQMVTLSSERFRAPEILFKPELIGRDHYGMHESVYKSILGSDIDLRRCFLGNIILSGGNTLLPGLPERLQAEIKGLVPADTGVSVCVTSPTDRDFSVWRGGAVLANLPSFNSGWISQEEYEEYGPPIVFRKCF